MSRKEVRYRHARGADGRIVDAVELASCESFDKAFTCPQCERVMVAAVRGSQQQPHFRHKAGEPCPFGSYVEYAACHTLAETFNDCIKNGDQFLVQMTVRLFCSRFEKILGRSCDTGEERPYQVDLTEHYTKAEVSVQGDKRKRAVTLLTSEKNKPPVAIIVTYKHSHVGKRPLPEIKRVVEVVIYDESDISELRYARLDERRCHFHRFQPKSQESGDEYCDCRFTQYYGAFLYKSGKVYFPFGRLDQITENLNMDSMLISILLPAPNGVPKNALRRIALTKLREAGHEVRNCLICNHHSERRGTPQGKSVFCTAKRIFCTWDEAVGCDQFKVRN